jgi:hypothetical protein
MFEKRALSRILGPMKDVLRGWWRKLHNEELHDLYSSPSIIKIIKSRRMRWVEPVTCIGDKRNVYRLLVENPEGKRPLGRPRRRWIDNIKMDLSELGLSVVDWIGLAQDRYRWRAHELGTESSGSIKCWASIEWLHSLWALEWYSAQHGWLVG